MARTQQEHQRVPPRPCACNERSLRKFTCLPSSSSATTARLRRIQVVVRYQSKRRSQSWRGAAFPASSLPMLEAGLSLRKVAGRLCTEGIVTAQGKGLLGKQRDASA